MSIDDFYLTHKDQEALNDQFDDNDLLQGRGLPGTHDMKLLGDCLRAILHGENPMATGASETQYVSLPQAQSQSLVVLVIGAASLLK